MEKLIAAYSPDPANDHLGQPLFFPSLSPPPHTPCNLGGLTLCLLISFFYIMFIIVLPLHIFTAPPPATSADLP